MLPAFINAFAGNVYYVATNGSDSNPGTITAPLATFGAAYDKAYAGDTVYFRGGTYHIAQSEIMAAGSGLGSFSYVFKLARSGNATAGRIVYAGYPGERPVFDFSAVLPQSRISGFYLYGSYIHLRNFDITGITATMHGHYQCECISARNGSYCIVENIAMHDNMAIGYYATSGHNNLVLNCDAYNNFDNYSAFKSDDYYNTFITTGNVPSGSTSETLGGNCDGFGFHASHDFDTCNVFRGCRAWWNSDDGFDCINSKAAVTWEDCWAFYNGFQPGGATARGDGNGFKAGGYGMSVPCTGYTTDGSGNPAIPQNIIRRCVAFYNNTNGFYANHHLGGNLWENNTAMYNNKNYDMTNRELATINTAAVNVRGYDHILRNNVSFAPKTSGKHWTTIDSTRCTLENNYVAEASDFINATRLSVSKMAQIALTKARQADGSLPEINFLTADTDSYLYQNNLGALFKKYHTPTHKRVPVIITAGQSNTDGRVPSADMPSYLSTYASTGMTGVYWSYGNSSGWSLTGGAGVFAPFYPMCESSNDRNRWAYDAVVYYNLAQHLTGDLYVIKESAGGTSIAPESTSSGNRHWSVNTAYLDTAGIVGVSTSASGMEGGALSPALIYNIRRCIATIEANGDTADIRCILWHQGESDRTPTASADAYHDNLRAVVRYIRDSIVAITGNTGYATLPFICGTVSKRSALYSSTIEKAQYRLAAEMTNFHVIDMQDGTILSDIKHFDAASAELFGKRLYNRLCRMNLFSAYGVQPTDSIEGITDAVKGVDFGDETVVSDSTKWVFTSFAHNATITDSLYCMDGLYLRGYTGNHAIIAKNVNSTIAAYIQASPSFVSDISTAGMAVTTANDRSVALNIAYPGTITIEARANSSSTDAAVQAREMVLWFNGDTVAHKSLSEIAAEGNGYKTTLTYEAKTAGVVYLTCANAFYVFSVEYIPHPEQEGGDDIISGEDTPKRTPKLHMCGDSMMSIYGDQSTQASANQDYLDGMRGWGQFFGEYFHSITVQDWAHTGTTAKGFYSSDNYWKAVMGTTTMTDVYKAERPYVADFEPVEAGDYVILCWGHNDQKASGGYRTITESEYLTYLTTMVNEVLAKGAYPVLATSICRSLWSNGSLTRLGRIDACEAAGATHSDTDDPYNYPQAMRNLAATLGLPLIDLNDSSRVLWEAFGPNLCGSVFFPNGGTTHTSETGARAMCIAAAQAIAAWDKSQPLYAPYATLIDSVLTGLVQYRKSDYAAVETTVSTETVWTFADYAAGDTIAQALLDYNGLYIRSLTGSHATKAVASPVSSITFSCDSLCPVTIGCQSAGNTALANNIPETAGSTVTNANDRGYAVNTAGAGTLYAVFYCTGSGTEASPRYVRLAFNGTEITDVRRTVSAKNTLHEVAYHATTGGTFCFWSEPTSLLLAVYYRPDTDNSEDNLHEGTGNVSVQTEPALPDWSRPVYNLLGQRVSPSFRGIVLQQNHKFFVR